MWSKNPIMVNIAFSIMHSEWHILASREWLANRLKYFKSRYIRSSFPNPPWQCNKSSPRMGCKNFRRSKLRSAKKHSWESMRETSNAAFTHNVNLGQWWIIHKFLSFRKPRVLCNGRWRDDWFKRVSAHS